MFKLPLQQPCPNYLRTSLQAVCVSIALAAMAACGGGSGSSSSTTPPPPPPGAQCTIPTGVPSASTTTLGVNTVGPATFMDLHVGQTSDWPTISFGGLRLWDTGTAWSQVNTADGLYDWTNLDSWVQDGQSHGVDLLYNLARTPSWASSNPTDTSCTKSGSTGGPGPGECGPPSDLNADGTGTDQHWINWITALSTRYKGQIKYYEIWNEWNVPLFWSAAASVQQPQLVRMEQDARCVVEGPPAGLSCNPNSVFPSGTGIDTSAQIVTPSPVGSGYPVANQGVVASRLGNFFSTTVNGYAGGQFSDIIGFHGYVGTPSGDNLCPVAENVTSVIDQMDATLNTYGETGKPWFNTEGGWSKAGEEGFGDQDRQAAFLARYFLLQRSMGVDRVYWYKWDNPSTTGGSLWNPVTGISEAGNVWTEVYNWVTGATLSSACTVSGTVWSCGLSRSGYQALAVWDASQDCTNGVCASSTFTVPSGGGYTLYRDLTGAETSITGTTVPISAKPILLETSALP